MEEGCGDREGKSGGGEEDMDVGECSEEEEDDEEDLDMGSSPIQQEPSSIMDITSPVSAPYEGLASSLRMVPPTVLSAGKPLPGTGNMKRGPGRPRSRGAGGNSTPPTPRPVKKPAVGLKLKRWKGLLVSGVYGSSGGKNGNEGEADGESTSPSQPSTPVDQLKGPIFVDEPRFDEQWPGKTCVLCNLSEHSQLGQGKMVRAECTLDDLPRDLPRESLMSPPETPPPLDSTSPRPPLQNRRQKGFSKFRSLSSSGQEPVDELSLVGHIDIPEPSSIVDAGFIYVHEWCAVWCPGVSRDENGQFVGVATGVAAAAGRRCYHCSRYGAGPPCIVPSCNKHFHVPCAAAAAAFQHVRTLTLICSQHVDHVPSNPNLSDVVCHSCSSLGNVTNLVMCSVCGNHHHGGCIGNALQPGLRAGWQCTDCRVCQLCRECEDTGRMLVCDSCDKAYHPHCVRPAMSSVPKVGWKCKRCRLCSDCGARTPGGGLSSRWHSNYTVCDSCYQQRNKGFSCPVCHKAYRAAALREMVKCSQCRRFVHGTCDKEADFVSYHRKKDAHPDYQYICLSCKNNSTLLYIKRKDSTEDVNIDSTLNVSQESLNPEEADGDSEKSDETPFRLSAVGLGKGKPFYASKIAKKKLGLGPGRPKGSGKMTSVALSHFQKRPRYADFGRKRGAKTKMRGIFGVPGLGLQRPAMDSNSKTEDEPGLENKLVLVSARDKFVLSQDLCVMCGALGIDQEACLIACSQCGQAYHPYCVSVKVTKVMLQRGWRCLDCTVCEGCGQRNDEGRLILCDDCDISYHIYCMDPPLGSVPTGVWKCKWCAQCQTCGANTPGPNSVWQSNFTQCGPCASRTACPACLELYTDGDLIIKCIHCERWLHCICDTISNESEAEACCSHGYTCILCRPNNAALVLPSSTPNRIPSPELTLEGKPTDYYVDGVCLSETGLQVIKTLSLESGNQPARRKRPGFRKLDPSSDLLDPDLENGEEKNAVYKDGMIWGSKENGPIPSPPDGFTLYTRECGKVILKRKKQRNLQKLGIGGFSAVKMRSSRFKDDDEHLYPEDRPKRKPRCNKKRSKIAESYPSYLQEAFFGKELLDITKETTQELESSTDESDDGKLRVVEEEGATQESLSDKRRDSSSSKITIKEEDGSDSETLLHLSENLLHNDLVNKIMNESAENIKSENLISENEHESSGTQKDELCDILGPHFNIESMVRETGLPNMDSKDVEEIFKSVVTDETRTSSTGAGPGRVSSPQQHHVVRSGPPVLPPSPLQYPATSPYNSEYSESPQFSPEGSWDDAGSYNRATSQKMMNDEMLGRDATISPVLYANLNHPEWQKEYPSWNERCKQIIKKWRTLASEEKNPYRMRARDNRTNIRIRKQEQDKSIASKSCREAEQERQWKQLQAMRQQQHMMSQARTQGNRVFRQLTSEGMVQFTTNEPVSSPHITQQLQVSTSQETNLGALGSPRSQFPGGGGTVKVAATGGVYRAAVRPPPSPFPGPRPPSLQQEEMNRQLRDLLQRHHPKQEAAETVLSPTGVLQSVQMRQPQPPRNLHPQSLQGMEPRVRLVVQPHQQNARFPGQGHVRLGVNRPQLQDQFLLQRQFAAAAAASQQHGHGQTSAIIRSGPNISEQVRLQTQPVDQRIQNNVREGEEIPESVTAELEKLEEEGGSIGCEADEVSVIFSGLVEDDDELLAEMGPDFNILEYADPELDTVSGGEKTNILDDLEEVDKKKEDDARDKNAERRTSSEVKVPDVRPETKPSEEESRVSTDSTQTQLPHQMTMSANSGITQPKIVGSGYQTQFVTPSTPLPRVQVLQQGGSSQVGRGGGGYASIPPPPPPPYPGPPPPYPGQQTTIRGAVVRSTIGGQLQQAQQRRPLLLQDLLEEEKREQEKASVTPSPASSLMSDADFEMLRADVLGSRTSSPPPPQPPQLATLNLVGPPPPPPPENIVTEADRQAQAQYEAWLRTTGSAVSQQIRYFETEVQKLRKIRKSLNSKQRQLRKNGNELNEKDAIELQRVTGEQNVLQKHLEAARKQSRQHLMVMQEYQTKHENKVTSGSAGSASPQSPLLSPAGGGGGGGPQSHQPSPQTSLSPVRHSPAGTPHSQSGDDKSESGLPSPRPPPMTPTPPSPHQFHQIRHPGLVPRFTRSPEGGLRPRLAPIQTSGFNSPRGMSPQPPSPQTLRLTPQQQQLLIQRHQLQQQKQQLLDQHPEAGAILSRQLMRQEQQRQFRGFPGPQSPGSQGGSPLYSPRAPPSPMVYQGQGLQTPTSPMPQFTQPSSPMQSPRLHYAPSSPLQQQYRPPTSPMPSPMRRPSSASPQGEGGGGNPFNPNNPIPIPPEIRRLKLGLRGGSPMWSDKRKRVQPGTSSEKVASLVCVDYNDFDEESPPMTPPPKPALIKKTETVKARQSEDTDSEFTVYDDIVLVDSCKDTNLEVEELQSALEGNVMSAVVSMPMVIDSGHIQMMDVEGLDDLVVLGVGNGTTDNDCILEVNKDLILNDDVKEDDIDEERSPPRGRGRMVGKVLPGGGTQNSPSPESMNNCDIFKKVDDKSKKIEKERKSSDERTVPVQPNVVVSRTATTFTPVVTQKTIPIVSDNRQLAIQQATVASLVQGAVNAAKLAAEAQKLPKSSQANEQHRPPVSRGPFGPLSVITSKSTETDSLSLNNSSIKPEARKPEINRFSEVDNNCQKDLTDIKQENKYRIENSSDIRLINTESSIIKYKMSDVMERQLSQGGDIEIKREFEGSPEKRDHNKMMERMNNLTSPKVENVALPCVSSSILEAQLTSMLRTEPNPNPKYIYTLVNHAVNKDQRKEDNSQDDMRMEGLAAHFQRTVNEDLRLATENELYRNSRSAFINKKHGNIYVSSPMKADTVMVGMKSYKIFQASSQSSTSDILTLREDKEDANGRVAHKVSIIERRLSGGNEKICGNEILQQRVVSSSEVTPEKETHHLSFGGPKPQGLQQKEEPKKFVSLTTMLLPRSSEEKRVRPGEDSQNVLLKQLLQNTACATTTATTTASLPIVPSLEAQLARPVPPTPSSLLPSVLNEPPKEIPQPKPQMIESPQESRPHVGPTSLDELLSPPPQPVQQLHQQTIQTNPTPVIKREPGFSLSQPGPVMTPMVDVKREVEVKKEVMSSDEMLSPGLRMDQSDSQLQDMKKLKRRPNQQKRRQSGGKEMVGGVPKKRPRKSSKVEEDYDSFIDSIMHQLRQTPGMTICEPNLTYNFTGCPPFGAGDMSKVNSCTRLGELRGTFGNGYLPHENDHYNTLPFGDLPPKAPSTPATQRGFYNEEFAPLKLHTAKDDFDDRKYDYNRDRDNDTPDTIVSSSSPECIMPEFHPRFPGLQLIDSDGEEERSRLSRFSPDIPLIAPLAIRPKPIRFYSDMDKENETPDGERGRIRESVTVTLTLTSQAADDVLSVLRNLANVLRIPVPATHSITERSSASHRLGLYRIKGKDGKEGAQIDIQSILNGTAKFCRHCDVVIINNLMRKKASEMPLVAKQGEEDLYFCSSTCYMQLALTHPQLSSKDKALTLVDHHTDIPNKKIKVEPSADSTVVLNEPKKEFKLSSELPSFVTTRATGKRDKPYLSGNEKLNSHNTIKIENQGKKAPLRFRTWTSNSIPPPQGRHKKPTDKEITEMLFKSGITVMPIKLPDDSRTCLLCHQVGDGVTDGPARLLNYDVNKWIHLNCALWSDEVYETVNGGLVNVEVALQSGMSVHCAYCNTSGATLKCYKPRCSVVYHLPCAVKDQCVFYKNKTLFCSIHVPKNEKENELTTLSVMRRVYISRDENRQVAAIMHHSEQTSLLRVGSLIFLSVGQLLPHQLQAFHTPNYIFPVGYKIVRLYWSMRTANKRCRYVCSIADVDGRPEFRITVEERGELDIELKDTSARGVWMKVLEPLSELRRASSVVQLFNKYVTGEDLFGLTEPAIVRVLESLPGIETLSDYKFKYGRNPLLELPLAVNPTGCARSEGKPKGWKRAHTQRATSLRGSGGAVFAPSAPLPGELACPYSKQFVHSKSSQYKKMKSEWRNNVYLARSKIQGLGLYAARDLERHTMVIEYIGEIIRTELAETREKQYEARNRGIYMFRLDEERVVDATLCGGLARYINHSCSPNCVAETVEVERDLRIIIFTKRRISRGEELAYDYKFDIEDDQHKIPCMCGAPNCRKWMN